MAITKNINTRIAVDDCRNKVTYEGLSTDSKPTTNVGTNDEFKELDTGKWYYYDGTAWQEGVGGGSNGGSNSAEITFNIPSTGDEAGHYIIETVEIPQNGTQYSTFGNTEFLYYDYTECRGRTWIMECEDADATIPVDNYVYYFQEGEKLYLPAGTYRGSRILLYTKSSYMYDRVFEEPLNAQLYVIVEGNYKGVRVFVPSGD